MPLLVRNDETIKVGTTPGLDTGLTSFTFDGTFGKPDYRGYEIIISEYGGRSPMIKGVDYTWDYTIAKFDFIQSGDIFSLNQLYNIHFQPAVPTTLPVSANSLIDETYFIRDINIPNIAAYVPSNAVTLQRLLSFIKKYEPECLRNLMGDKLFKAFLTEFSARVNDIMYGADYTDYYGVDRRWRGLVQPPEKISLIANYVYCKYEESNASQSTGIGTVIPKGSTFMPVSPGQKILDSWNFFSAEADEFLFFLWNMNISSNVYPEFTSLNLSYGRVFSRSNYTPF